MRNSTILTLHIIISNRKLHTTSFQIAYTVAVYVRFLEFGRSANAMFTLYRIVKRSIAESVQDMASVHTIIIALEAVPAPEQDCSAPPLKVERSVLDRFLTRSNSNLNTFIGAKHATKPRIGK